MTGFAIIDKLQGMTSHDVVYRARKILGIKRIGHAGTLDPMATGVLVLAIGYATRVLPYLETEPKVYRAQITLGVETNTQDAEGETVRAAPHEGIALDDVRVVVSEFVGEIEQVPPMFSAVKKQGKPLYAYARKGVEVERETRKVKVYSFEIDSYRGAVIEASIVCSGGTYVRTLAHDLGQRLGCGAHLSALRRTAVGKFAIENAISLDRLDFSNVIKVETALEPLPAIRLTADQSQRIRHGQAIRLLQLPSEKRAVFLDDACEFLAIAENRENTWQPLCVAPKERGER
ncbi:MAG: tRNA pseudouridine(55) synthase TruB [Fimbriimonadales bacterium]|nr:tRNA pseudouridine(55) synthase TruB [Fimbriimonadales bacterium]